jgi:cytochrome oxidase assembly protein ShyY1
MNNELLFSFMAVFGSIFAGLQIWQIKRISDLCERVAKIETEIEHHFDKRHA